MQLVEIEFRSRRRVVYANPEGYPLASKDAVIVQADRGVDLGVVNLVEDRFANHIQSSLEDGQEPESVIRLAQPEDFDRLKENINHESEAKSFFREEIARLELEMKLVEVECQLDKRKLTFYFTADGRVDFRELVKSLAQKFHTRIDLRQIGARDESKRLGGIGICGRELCCSSWIREFKPVTTSMMKDQHMILNPQKNTGPCGKLRCCLRYEVDQYRELNLMFPKVGTRVKGPRGAGRVIKFSYNWEHVGIEWEDGAKYSYGMEHLTECSDWKSGNKSPGEVISFKTDPSQEEQRKIEEEGELVARATPQPTGSPKVSVRSTPRKKGRKPDAACPSCGKTAQEKARSPQASSQVVQLEPLKPSSTGGQPAKDEESPRNKARRGGTKRRGRGRGRGKKTVDAAVSKQRSEPTEAGSGSETAQKSTQAGADANASSEDRGQKSSRRRGSGRSRNRHSGGEKRNNTSAQQQEKKPRDNRRDDSADKPKQQSSKPNHGRSEGSASKPQDSKPVGRPLRPNRRNRKR